MNKEEALNEFLKALRIVLNNASAYSFDHPYFKKSVEVFKQHVDALFQFLNPININITCGSLFIDGKCFEKAALYVDLATMFHQRKIKSIKISSGLALDELIKFLSSVSLPIKEILRNGGMQNILNQGKSDHIIVEELDYSELLGSEGEESKDIWVYLFKETVKKEDSLRIEEFANNFESIIGKFKLKDFFEDEELRESIYNFLVHLRDKQKEKFYKCTKEFFRFVLKDKNIAEQDKIDKIKAFFKDLSKEDFTDAVWDEISKESNFDYFSFAVLARIVDEDTNKGIASGLENKIRNSELIKSNPLIRKKIKELFSEENVQFISPLYRHALQWLATEDRPVDNLTFDREALKVNYYFILLNLLWDEKTKEVLTLVSDRILKECDKITEAGDLEYLGLLFGVLSKKIKEDSSLSGVFEKIISNISSYIEKMIFEAENPQALEAFVENIDRSILGYDYYRDKIFQEGKINSFVLRLALRLFPENLTGIYEDLKNKREDIDFMVRFLNSLEGVDNDTAIEVLKRIYSFSTNIVKIEVLKSMQSLAKCDERFLLTILEKEEFYFRKGAFLILAKDNNQRKIALERLLSKHSLWGEKNNLLIENLVIIEELETPDAISYLVSFSKMPFFWNRKLRNKSLEVLKKWNVK